MRPRVRMEGDGLEWWEFLLLLMGSFCAGGLIGRYIIAPLL